MSHWFGILRGPPPAPHPYRLILACYAVAVALNGFLKRSAMPGALDLVALDEDLELLGGRLTDLAAAVEDAVHLHPD